MTFFNLHFPDKSLETQFRASFNPSKSEKYLEILFLGTFILLSFSKAPEVIIGAGIFAFIIIFLSLLKITGKYFGFSLVIGLSISIFYSFTRYPIMVDFDDSFEAFKQGWSIACIEVVLVSQAPCLKDKITVLIISVILRFGALGGFDGKILTAESLFRSILYDVFLIHIFYRFESGQRNLFKSYHDTQQEVSQLKNILQKLSSPCLYVIDFQTHKALFQNQAFDLLLQTFENNNSDPFGAFQRALQINNDISLKDFIQKLQIRNFADSETWLLSGSCKTQEKLLFFDITIVSIIWNKSPSILVALENITHKKELSDLQLVQEDKDLLIATVSHELRNPLQGILGLIQIVEPKIKETETLEYLSLCKDNANLLLNLVNSLLDNQQIQHGDIKLNVSQVQIETLVKGVLSLFSFQASQKNTKLSFFIQDGVPSHIITDENRIKQVLINLVSNALKFTLSGSITIKISQRDQNHLRFSVSDTGQGIKRSDLNKIFQTYSKLEDKEGLNKHGVGLGLTISNSIARLLANHQNGINVESQYGSGSTFSFLVHQNLKKVLDSQKAYSLTGMTAHQSSVQNIQEFEEFSNPNDLTSKLSFYNSLPNSSSPKDSRFLRISNFSGKTGASIGQELSHHRSNSTPINVSKMTKSEPRLHNHHEKRVLVVDDNYFNILIAKNLLENSGYQVQTALSGQEAIEKFEDSINKGLSFFCILMDCQMPLMDGFETTKILNKVMMLEKIKAVPIVALTASQDKNTRQKCLDNGMTEHLSKPLIKEDILRVLVKFEGKP